MLTLVRMSRVYKVISKSREMCSTFRNTFFMGRARVQSVLTIKYFSYMGNTDKIFRSFFVYSMKVGQVFMKNAEQVGNCDVGCSPAINKRNNLSKMMPCHSNEVTYLKKKLYCYRLHYPLL